MNLHYGHCKQEIESLKQQLAKSDKDGQFYYQLTVTLQNEINESKGVFEYAMHEKEQEIEALKGKIATRDKISQHQHDKKGKHEPKNIPTAQ